MKIAQPSQLGPEDLAPPCVVRAVAEALAHEPTLEAVTINRARRTISVATLGRIDEAKLSQRITDTIQNAQAAEEVQRCGLLEGTSDCATCMAPLTTQERRHIRVEHDGAATTISRVTCPTAPRFWRWRDVPWPRVVQRDVEFYEHADRDRRMETAARWPRRYAGCSARPVIC